MWPTLAALGISLPKGDVIIRVVGKDVIARQALVLNARHPRGLTLDLQNCQQ